QSLAIVFLSIHNELLPGARDTALLPRGVLLHGALRGGSAGSMARRAGSPSTCSRQNRRRCPAGTRASALWISSTARASQPPPLARGRPREPVDRKDARAQMQAALHSSVRVGLPCFSAVSASATAAATSPCSARTWPRPHSASA